MVSSLLNGNPRVFDLILQKRSTRSEGATPAGKVKLLVKSTANLAVHAKNLSVVKGG